MNRNLLLAVGGAIVVTLALTGGVAMAASTVPSADPLPTTTPIAPQALGDGPTASDPAPAPAATLPPYDPPSARHADVLRPDDVLVTRERLVEYAVANEWRIGPDYGEWVEVNARVVECMAEAGFWFDPIVFPGPRPPAPPAGFNLALFGDTGAGDAYRWEDAGCWGAVTHALGTTS